MVSNVLRLGLHVSIQGEIEEAVDRAIERGCSTMQLFTRSPRGWRFRPLREEAVECFKAKLKHSGIAPVFGHMPYLPNLASPKDTVYTLSVRSLGVEFERCVELGIPYLVSHLGSNLGSGKTAGLKRVVAAINLALGEASAEITILLENTAGTKNSMGSTFEDIRRVIDSIRDQKHVGVCLDTCHAFAAGYDFLTPEAVTRTLECFENAVGMDRLRIVHLNDSKGGLRSHLDRHEHIGLGRIGEQGFRNILSSPLGRLPLILETPLDERRSDLGNIQKVRELATQ